MVGISVFVGTLCSCVLFVAVLSRLTVEQVKNFFIFLAIFGLNAVAVYWIAATPDLIQAVGQFVDQYVFPGVISLVASIAMFWGFCKIRYIADRLEGRY